MEIPTELNLMVDETVLLQLPGLATAGYQWVYDITQPQDRIVDVSAVNSEHDLATARTDQPAIGSSQDEVFRIQALRPGKATLRLMQQRSWEREQPPLQDYQIEIVVQ